jgi:hypothetical protein
MSRADTGTLPEPDSLSEREANRPGPVLAMRHVLEISDHLQLGERALGCHVTVWASEDVIDLIPVDLGLHALGTEIEPTDDVEYIARLLAQTIHHERA